VQLVEVYAARNRLSIVVHRECLWAEWEQLGTDKPASARVGGRAGGVIGNPEPVVFGLLENGIGADVSAMESCPAMAPLQSPPSLL
jgi:hypothetical protein